MANVDHFAVLLGISYYPGMRSLEGPENDILAFRDWLEGEAGGDVPTENITLIQSSNYPRVVNPHDACPTEQVLKKALDNLVREAAPPYDWKSRVGSRLYLYMAGHGFTAGSSFADPALFSAVARLGDTAHIAGLRYAARIASAGFFDEIVLVMDCCQGVLMATQIGDPTWDPPDRNKSKDVKILQAYGAPRGEIAYERPIGADGEFRGIFSSVFLEALETALPNSAGFVTGLTLKNQVRQLWVARHKTWTGYEPPIRLPDGDDINLFRRDQQGQQSDGRADPIRFFVKDPIPSEARIKIVSGSKYKLLAEFSASDSKEQSLRLPPGLYKAILSGTDRTHLFEVVGNDEVAVTL